MQHINKYTRAYQVQSFLVTNRLYTYIRNFLFQHEGDSNTTFLEERRQPDFH